MGFAPPGAAGVSGLPLLLPPAAVCGNPLILNGPLLKPAGAVAVRPGDDLHAVTQSRPPGTTFWLAPGTHQLGPSEFSQVVPKDNDTYIGAPGAVLDGRGVNRYAFTQQATGVQVRNLTIQGFVAPPNEGVVNHDSAAGWVIEANTIKNNRGAAVMMGSANTVRLNCLADNGQYGINAYRTGGLAGITVDRNEIARNNTDDWEARVPGCGCAGATRFWEVNGATVTGNWVHDNKGPGLWADTNNVGFRIEGNLIERNDGEGIVYETSYNARIANNTLRRNALVKGRQFAARNDSFPVGAVYISESGGDARLNGGTYAAMEITNNYFEDNWGGVVLWENADRFCNSPANTSTGACTKGGAATLSMCSAATIATQPYLSDCRWKTKNVAVRGNDFRLDKAAIGCTPGAPCGRQGLLSNYGTFPSWSPYQARTVSDAITFQQNNRFSANRYVGDWKFVPYTLGGLQPLPVWQSAFGQDLDSSLTPALTPLAQNGVEAPALPSLPANAIDADTATIESSIGQWIPWFSAATTRSGAAAHSGANSLRVDITAPYGWGVQLRNWPGFTASPGLHVVSFWAAAGSTTALSVDMAVHWRDASGHDLAVDTLSIALLTPAWQHASAIVSAPAGTAVVSVDFTNSAGGPGDSLYIDDIVVFG